MIIGIALTLIGVFYPVFYEKLQRDKGKAAESKKRGEPDVTASEQLSVLFWVFLASLICILVIIVQLRQNSTLLHTFEDQFRFSS